MIKIACQGYGRGIDGEFIRMLGQRIQNQFGPDLTLLFDALVGNGLVRAQTFYPCNRFEAETLAFCERVRDAYFDQAACFPERIEMIDASRPLPVIPGETAAHPENGCRS